MNTEVNFEIAKMLKEKGFDNPCYDAYNIQGNKFSNGWCEYIYDDEKEIPFTRKDLKPQDTLAPTIAQAIMWVYEKHGVWIYSYHNGTLFIGSIQDSTGSIKGRLLGYKTPTEAYEAAIEYALTNLV